MPEANRILIIDDMEANRYAFSRILRKAGYETLEAEGVQKGMALLDPKKVDLVILDVQMPDGNGFDVCVQIKNDPALSHIPVLMTSASFVEGSDIAQGLDSGAEGYLTTPIDPQELVATVRSLFRVRDAERKLKIALEKAEAANIAKTEFLANMSHEIRTPMNAIIGLTQILARTPLSVQQQKFVATLQDSGTSLMNLINDLLDITKIEDNMMELEKAAFSLSEIIKRITGMMSLETQKKGLTLSYNSAKMADVFVGDPQRLYQVILNIVSNAIKFTEHGGIAIDTSMQTFSGSSPVIEIRITDSGIGIPSEKLTIIFNKFTQADNSTTRKYGGSGLGLAISKRLIEQMEGTIRVESTAGKGSLFIIALPLQEAKAGHKLSTLNIAHEAYVPGDPAQGTILLVEDHEPNVLVATTLLEKLGYKCVIAYNGLEALALLEDQQFDAILMDVQMGEIDGFETTRRIRKWEKLKACKPLPIIAMTAHVMAGDREKCLAAGMDDYISKPIDSMELEKKLARIVHSATAIA